MDYRDHRPDLNALLFQLLASGLGLRQSARLTRLSLSSTQEKFRKIARHLRSMNSNLRGVLPAGCALQFDEFETYEGSRKTRPLSIPFLLERDSRFIIWSESATIRPRGRKSEARKRAIEAEVSRYGPRRDRSRTAILRTLRHGARLAKGLTVLLDTDAKTSYPKLVLRAFGPHGVLHRRTSSRSPRTKWNPLFPINHSEAMARDLMGRLRRDSWLNSKVAWCLDLALHLFMAYRNYVRVRFNRDADKLTPAQRLGFVDRRMSAWQVLSWRQDWNRLSIHPLADPRRLESVKQVLPRANTRLFP